MFANTRKHIDEHSCSPVRVNLSILTHLAHLAQSFFLFHMQKMNKYIDTCLSKQIQESMSLSRAAHLSRCF